MKNTERFSERVENYVHYRPSYPKELISFLKEHIGLNQSWVIADIGSGTGISSEMFLKNGSIVYGIEPNQEMRQEAEKTYKNQPKFISINATAESTSLPNQSIDLIIAAQAFHWFNHSQAKKEFQRIAAPNAYTALIWNERSQESDFQQAYEQFLQEFALNYENVASFNANQGVIQSFFAPQPFFAQVFRHAQALHWEGLKGRVLSCSYIPLEGHPGYQPMIHQLEQLFRTYNKKGIVTIEYLCKLFYGNL